MSTKETIDSLNSIENEEDLMRENRHSKPLNKDLVKEAEKKAKFYLINHKYPIKGGYYAGIQN